jgi:hypothetical protein
VGYPTQKPVSLLHRVIRAHSNEGETVADFYCGSGTTALAAQELNRRWITCDESAEAVSIASQRLLSRNPETTNGANERPDVRLEYCGTFAPGSTTLTDPHALRAFVLRALGARPLEQSGPIHATQSGMPVCLADMSPNSAASAADVNRFAAAVEALQPTSMHRAAMVAWRFQPDALQAAECWRASGRVDLGLVLLERRNQAAPRLSQGLPDERPATDLPLQHTLLSFRSPTPVMPTPTSENGSQRA